MTDLSAFFTLSDYEKGLYAKAKVAVAEIEEARNAQNKHLVVVKPAQKSNISHTITSLYADGNCVETVVYKDGTKKVASDTRVSSEQTTNTTKKDEKMTKRVYDAVLYVAQEAARAARKVRDDAFLEADSLVCINENGCVDLEACEKKDAILAAAQAAEKIAEATADAASKLFVSLGMR